MTQPPKFIDTIVTHQYHMLVRDVGDMYKKYVDENIIPRRPECSSYLLIITNRLAKLDTVSESVSFYDKATTLEDITSEKVLHLRRDFEVSSPYTLYRIMDIIGKEKELYLTITYDWIANERPDDKNEMKNILMN